MAINEKRLIRLLKDDNINAFEGIYKHYSPKVFNFCRKNYLKDYEAEEIVQIVFIALWENRRKIDENKPLSNYLYTIARNLTVSTIRKTISRQLYIEYILINQKETSQNAVDKILFDELNGLIDNCIQELPRQRQEIFRLSRKNGLTYREISEKLNITESTVNTNITKSIQYIRDKLKFYF